MSELTQIDQVCRVADYYGLVDTLLTEDLTAWDAQKRLNSLGYRVAPELVEAWLKAECVRWKI